MAAISEGWDVICLATPTGWEPNQEAAMVLIGWNMSAKAQGSDSASDHNKVSLKGNESKAGTVSESGIMAVNWSSLVCLLAKFTGFIFNYDY